MRMGQALRKIRLSVLNLTLPPISSPTILTGLFTCAKVFHAWSNCGLVSIGQSPVCKFVNARVSHIVVAINLIGGCHFVTMCLSVCIRFSRYQGKYEYA